MIFINFLLGVIIKAEILYSNTFKETQNLYSLNITHLKKSIDSNEKLVITLVALEKDVPLLAICPIIPNNYTLLLEQLNIDDPNLRICKVDYTSYINKELIQQIVFTTSKMISIISSSHNIYSLQTDQELILVLYNNYTLNVQIEIQSQKLNECTRQCQNGGVCINGYCQCPLGYFSDNCRIQAQNILQTGYFYGSQIFFLDLIILQTNDFTLKLEEELNFTILCSSNNSNLINPQILNSTLQVLNQQILNCKLEINNLTQYTHLKYYAQIIFTTYTNKTIRLYQQNDSNFSPIIILMILSTILGSILLFSLIVYIFKRIQIKKEKKKKNLYDNVMPVVQFVSVTDRLQNNQQNDNQCSICLEKFKPNSAVRMTYCEHLFHSNCLESWMKKNKNCPLCRSSLDTQTITSRNKIESKREIKNNNNILNQLSHIQKHEVSCISIDGSSFHSPVVTALTTQIKASKFALK